MKRILFTLVWLVFFVRLPFVCVNAMSCRIGKVKIVYVIRIFIAMLVATFGLVPTSINANTSNLTDAWTHYFNFEYAEAKDSLMGDGSDDELDPEARKLLAFIYSDIFGPLYNPSKARVIFDKLMEEGDLDAAIQIYDSWSWDNSNGMTPFTRKSSNRAGAFGVITDYAKAKSVEAIFRARMACQFEGERCGDDLSKFSFGKLIRATKNGSLEHKKLLGYAVATSGVQFKKYLTKDAGESYRLPTIEQLSDEAKQEFYNRSRFGASEADPYSAMITLVVSLKGLEGIECQSAQSEQLLSLVILKENSFFEVISAMDSEIKIEEIEACIQSLFSEYDGFTRDLKAVGLLVRGLGEQHIQSTYSDFVFFEERDYNEWCKNVSGVEKHLVCQLRSYLDHYFRCDRVSLPKIYDRYIGVENINGSDRYQACRRHFVFN